uniref:Ribosomal protein L16 n=1 Tax=Gredgaria maugeana TaxID=2007213 RepID=UPI0022FDAAE5|nr:Ribosomal protein L16 [Gredgaria maugeana]WAX04203.1 Ribosomal protein L16 [Gredgaria maugeana]
MQKKLLNYRKTHFYFKNILSFKKHFLKFGIVGFKLKKSICFTNKQKDILKLFLLKFFKKIFKKSKFFFSMNFFYSYTQLPLESRMGKGKGEILYNFGYYKKGFILFEIKSISLKEAMKLQIYLNKKKILKVNLIY